MNEQELNELYAKIGKCLLSGGKLSVVTVKSDEERKILENAGFKSLGNVEIDSVVYSTYKIELNHVVHNYTSPLTTQPWNQVRLNCNVTDNITGQYVTSGSAQTSQLTQTQMTPTALINRLKNKTNL